MSNFFNFRAFVVHRIMDVSCLIIAYYIYVESRCFLNPIPLIHKAFFYYIFLIGSFLNQSDKILSNIN